jgi:hypothetical protein
LLCGLLNEDDEAVRGLQRIDIRLHDRKLIPWSRTFRDKLPANHVPLLIPHFVEPTDSLLFYHKIPAPILVVSQMNPLPILVLDSLKLPSIFSLS